MTTTQKADPKSVQASNWNVSVDYFRNIDRVPNLSFARALMLLLKSSTLQVRATAPKGSRAQLSSEQANRIRSDVAKLTGIETTSVEIVEDFAPGALAVDNFPNPKRSDISWVVPMDERGLNTRGKGPILVPFGNGISAMRGYNLAAQLVLAANAAVTAVQADSAQVDTDASKQASVLFYHTTWKNPSVKSEEAAQHMCPQAVAIRNLLEKAAADAGVPFTTVIQTADDVADGILHTALMHQARLIIMPQSKMVEVGDYCFRVIAKSPVPIIALAKSAVGGA